MTKPHTIRDQNHRAQVGERVFFRSPACSARVALVGNVDQEGGPVDLVVFCQGGSAETRERWANGWGVVGFRGLVEHVTVARERKLPNWWSRSAEDCPSAAEDQERQRSE